MLKMWGRNTSSNVQKAMWAVGELRLPCERIDVGGAFGRTKEPFYLAMNPNSLVPTLEEEDGFTMWESNSIVRYLAAKHASALEPKDLKTRALASKHIAMRLKRGDVIRYRSAGGGGWGDPSKRAAEAVAADQEAGYVE